jgi:tetratricopeptide (TPR) repeat protein
LAALAGIAAAQTAVFAPEQLARIQRGLRDVYNLEHGRAIENYEGMIRESPEDPAGYAFLAYTYLAQELATRQGLSIDRFAASDFFSERPRGRAQPDAAFETKLRRASDQAIQKARARLAKDPRDTAAQFLLGLAYQNLASYETSLGRWWGAFRLGNQTLRHHRELLRRDPNFHDARLALGVYNYVTGSLGWNVKWLAFLMGYRGSKQRGKQELETTAEKALLVGDDARLVLILIHAREKDFERAVSYLSELQQKYPQNYVVHLDMGGMELLRKRPAEAAAIYQDILKRNYAGLERASVYNRLGVALRENGDLNEASGWFEKALAEPGLSARSATVGRLELGKTLDLLGRRDEAREHYRAVTTAEDVAGSRQEAQELLRRPYRR